MAPQTQVKVFDSSVAAFGGIALRRVQVCVGGRLLHLLTHEQPESRTFVIGFAVGSEEQAAPPLLLLTEWGEPLGEIVALDTDERTGEITGYRLRLRLRDGRTQEISAEATAVFWWNGELCARKRLSYQLRDLQRGLQRGKRPRSRPEAA